MLVWSWRSVVTTFVVLATVFGAGLVVGFLLEHEPAPDDRHISISSPLQPPSTETRTAGEVTRVGDGRIELRTLGGVVGLDLGPGASVEELIRVTDARFAPGDAVNLGGEQGDFGIVLTGVVVLEPVDNAEASR